MLEDDVVKVCYGWWLVANWAVIVNRHLTCMFIIDLLQALISDLIRFKPMELNINTSEVQGFFHFNELKDMLAKQHFLED